MSSGYPTTLDAFSTTHVDDGTEVIHAASVNDLADAVNKIEAELGTLPKGAAASVKARIVATETVADAAATTASSASTVANAAVPKSVVDAAGDLIIGSGADAVTRLAVGAAGQVLGGTGPSYTYPLGYLLAYVETATEFASITASSAATATEIISAGAVTYAAELIRIEINFGDIRKGTTMIRLNLWDGATDLGLLCQSGAERGPAHIVRYLTPTAASHTYKVKAYVDAGTGQANVSSGLTQLPAYIRVTKA